MLQSILLLLFITTALSQCTGTQSEIDACYMKMALDFALTHNKAQPFGTLIVDHVANQISCFGVNSMTTNVLLHGESSAFLNCTELYPSPTHDDMRNPGLDWSHQTLYTTGEPCPMCASQSVYRGVKRVVWGSNTDDLNLSGCPQIMIPMKDVIASAQKGGRRADTHVPELTGGVLQEACDHAFWCAFKVYRGTAYYASMKQLGLESWVADRQKRFKCNKLLHQKEGDFSTGGNGML